jgi:ribonucleoside-diphosphate reductase alpha chain
LIKRASEEPGFDDSWPLIDPHSKKVTKVVPAKALWVKILQNRVETGEPYIMFKDTVQAGLPEWQKKLGLEVHHSNLCTEITLATNEDRTAVCCLSSVNLEEFDAWSSNEDFIPDIIRMLDNVLTHFINNAPPELAKAVNSARQERSIGLGAMGLHAYLQRHNVAFESVFAKRINDQLYKHIKAEALRADDILARERGECPDAIGTGRRFSHLLAPAPNASSSIICGNTSPANELYAACAFTQKTKSGTSLLKNEYLEHILQELGQDNDEVWKDIITSGGSVQHLDFLDQHTKNVFKTAMEVDQRWVVELAADRQKYICQSQSINLFYPADVSKKTLHDHHMMAWERGMKTLYYVRSKAMKRAENVSTETVRQVIFADDGCLACEG